MYTSAAIILGVMVLVYFLALWIKLSTELAMLVAALAGAIAGGHFFPARHVAEGAITYLDINLIFICATLFMNILKESGGVAFLVRSIIKTFHKSRVLLLTLLAILLLIPGALTGAGSVTVLIMGSMVAVVLNYMGITKIRTAAIIFLIAGLSAAAPPVSLWAMMTAAGVNMPYVGFFWPLLIPCVIGALFTIFFLGWKGHKIDVDKAFEELPVPPEKMNWTRIIIPFLIFFGLMFMGRKWPHDTPVIGLPLMFLLSALASFLLSPKKLDFFRISADTIKQLLPLIGTLTCVGILVQIMTLTGVRGLLAITFITLPAFLVIGSLFFFLPITESVLMYGSAAVFGVPLVLLFNSMGLNPIVALAGMSVIWPLGDALPPTAIIGRLTVDVAGATDNYGKFLKQCIVPAIVIMVLGTLMVIYSKQLGFLTGI
jgi:CitMHS family citrate-Mg2+:H+ or citrate-Ca2+:H+ symporter